MVTPCVSRRLAGALLALCAAAFAAQTAGAGTDWVSTDSLYFRVLGQNRLFSSAKTQNPTLTGGVPMLFQYPGTVVCMSPAGDYVYEVYNTKLRRYSTADGSYIERELYTLYGNGACATDGNYVYVPSALQVWRVTPTGSIQGFNILTRGISYYIFSVVNETLWTGATGDSIMYGYACCNITGSGQPIAPDDSWNIGPGAGSSIPMSIAWDGTHYYVTYGLMGPPFTFKRFNRNRTLYSTGTVAGNTYSVMAAVVPGMDVQTLSVVAPAGTINQGSSVIPQASLRNNGGAAVTFSVKFDISDGYTCTRACTLAAGQTRTVTFSNWTADSAGSFSTRCSTRLSGDVRPGNDRATDTVIVQRLDVQPLAILAPAGSVNYGQSITPFVRVANNGNTSQSFTIRLAIGGGYLDTQPVTLGPGAQDTVAFALWSAAGSGTVAVRCSTRLSGDMNPLNDTLSGACYVVLHDVMAEAVLAPVGATPPGPLVPRARVRNQGSGTETFKAFFLIDTVYRDSAVVMLESGASRDLSFAGWTAVPGEHSARCSVYLSTDRDRTNDTVSRPFSVHSVDMAALRIVAPAGVIDTHSAVMPRAIVRNFGATQASFRAFLTISGSTGMAYRDSLSSTGLASGDSAALSFVTWPGRHSPGPYAARCSVYIAGDQNPANDVVLDSFAVTAGSKPIAGWREQRSMPTLKSGKQVRYGGWLTFDASTGLIYAAKGNRTPDFYSYRPAVDSWRMLASIPTGNENKSPAKGSVGVSDGAGTVYATKGDNSQGFWRYVAARDSWAQLADVPLGVTNKKVKGGTDAVYHNGYVYLLKGYKNEFWRYDVSRDSWQSLAAAPADKWNKGSWLVCDSSGTIHAHQAKEHGFYDYNSTTQSWGRSRMGMPLIGRSGKSKSSKDGGCAAQLGGRIYALKGSNTQEFWRYDLATDSWAELETLPRYGSTYKKKLVKAGADIAATSEMLFALKGNKTLEFWRYVPATLGATHSVPRSTQLAGKSAVGSLQFAVTPNPLRSGIATVRAPVAKWSSGRVRIDVTDICGRNLQSEICNLKSEMTLDLRSLDAGVYLVQLRGAGVSASQKLIIER